MLNLATFHGRLVRDVELKEVNGKEFCEFAIACNRDRDDADFIECKAWGKSARFIADYFHKGKGIIVVGRMRQERWEKNGEKKQRLVCVVHQAQFDGSPKDDRQEDRPARAPQVPQENKGSTFDDLPF